MAPLLAFATCEARRCHEPQFFIIWPFFEESSQKDPRKLKCRNGPRGSMPWIMASRSLAEPRASSAWPLAWQNVAKKNLGAADHGVELDAADLGAELGVSKTGSPLPVLSLHAPTPSPCSLPRCSPTPRCSSSLPARRAALLPARRAARAPAAPQACAARPLG